MTAILTRLGRLHDTVFGAFSKLFDHGLGGLLARLVFAGVLLVYYWHSAGLKVEDGLSGFFSIRPAAYFQILPSVVEAYGYDPSQVPFFPWGLIVTAGTYAEFLLPLLVVVGLFTRLAALGMIGFIAVQSFVDIAFHGANEAAVGVWFDRLPDALIFDQRAFWVLLLVTLVAKGGGWLSLDQLAGRFLPKARKATAAGG
ncbi:MAG: DoxX family membrane protein [Hyphomicrobiaceae bacterium]|nr:DoxX family membrane protein [Hyphomicrobiaceae bacterium]